MSTTTKVLGWGKCTVKVTETSGATPVSYSDIKEGTTSLSAEEGSIDEALIEGGECEGMKAQPDKYILEYDRRIGVASEVTPGFTESVASVEVVPPTVGAIGITLTNPCRKITLVGDSTDGLVAHYWFKTKGATGSNGALSDITASAVAAAT